MVIRITTKPASEKELARAKRSLVTPRDGYEIGTFSMIMQRVFTIMAKNALVAPLLPLKVPIKQPYIGASGHGQLDDEIERQLKFFLSPGTSLAVTINLFVCMHARQ